MSTHALLSEDLPAYLTETRVNEACDFPTVARSAPPARVAAAPVAPPRRYLRPSAHWADRWLTITKP